MWSVSHLMDQPTALTPLSAFPSTIPAANLEKADHDVFTVWNKISAKIIEHVENNKRIRLAAEAKVRTEERRQLVKPYYEALLDAATEKKLFPPFGLFACMPAVQTFWKEEGSSIDEDAWHSALEEIQAQIPKVERWIKLEFARTLLDAHANVGHELSEALRSSISPRGKATANDDYYGRYEHNSRLDIDDPSTISPSDLDTLLSRSTSTFRKYYSAGPPLNWIDYYDAEKQRSGTLNGMSGGVPEHWIKTLLGVLRQTELEDDSETEGKLERLGAKFDCERCHNNLPYRPQYSWYGANNNVVKPQKITGLTWKEMVSFPLSRTIGQN